MDWYYSNFSQISFDDDKGAISVLARVSNFGEASEPRLRCNSDIDEWDDNPPGGGEPHIVCEDHCGFICYRSHQ